MSSSVDIIGSIQDGEIEVRLPNERRVIDCTGGRLNETPATTEIHTDDGVHVKETPATTKIKFPDGLRVKETPATVKVRNEESTDAYQKDSSTSSSSSVSISSNSTQQVSIQNGTVQVTTNSADINVQTNKNDTVSVESSTNQCTTQHVKQKSAKFNPSFLTLLVSSVLVALGFGTSSIALVLAGFIVFIGMSISFATEDETVKREPAIEEEETPEEKLEKLQSQYSEDELTDEEFEEELEELLESEPELV